jgi:uncharacterized protein YdeI (YjbR/CyaY-like superfamily)
MGKSIDALKEYYPKDRKAWRKWLEKNHAKSPGIWLMYYKKGSGKPRVDYGDAVEEALCFGWIDSTSRPKDEESYIQLFVPRKPTSTWSKLNKERIEKLEKEGLMTDAGRDKITVAKENGSWTKLDAVEALLIPQELEKAFARNKTARKNFDAMSPSVRKQFLHWLNNTKKEETRKQRVADIIRLTKENKQLYRRENGKVVSNVTAGKSTK